MCTLDVPDQGKLCISFKLKPLIKQHTIILNIFRFNVHPYFGILIWRLRRARAEKESKRERERK